MSHLDEGLLHALLDGEISSSDLPPIQAHLARCSECQARLEEERRLLGEADHLVTLLELPAEPDRSAGTRVTPSAGRWARRQRIRGLAWAASVIAAVGLGYAARGLPTVQRPSVATASRVDSNPIPAAVQSTAESEKVAPRTEMAPRDADRRDARQPALRPRPQPSAPAAGLGEAGSAGRSAPIRVADEPKAASPLPRPTPIEGAAPPLSAPPAREVAGRAEGARLDQLRAGGLAGFAAAAKAAPPLDTVTFPDAVRRLGGSLRLIQGLIPLRLEAEGPIVRVVYLTGYGELILAQQLVDGRLEYRLIAPQRLPPDSLEAFRARVRE